jgi:DNA transformation protein
VSISDGFRDYLQDLLEPLGPVTFGRLFGGATIFYGEAVFALVFQDVLYLRVDDTNRAAFEAAGSIPFSYVKKTGPVTVGTYWLCPDEVMDDPDDMLAWARSAVDAGLAAQREKHKKAAHRAKLAKKSKKKK